MSRVKQRVRLAPGSRTRGLPRCLSAKASACQCKRSRRHRFDPWVRKVPWRSKWQPTPVFLPGQESHGQRSLVGYSLWSCKRVRLSDWTITMSSVTSGRALLTAVDFTSRHNMLTAQCSCLKMHNWPLFFVPFHFTLPSIVSVQDLLGFLFSINIFPFLHICPQGIF